MANARERLRSKLESLAGLPGETISSTQLNEIIRRIKERQQKQTTNTADWVAVALEVTDYHGPMLLTEALDMSDLNALLADMEAESDE